tara:strand:- start:464 stop:592 length:129 start_codon:yes stop_codon:yes gene_type:complete
MFKFIKNLFKPVDPIEAYLANSEDLVDLERRMQELKRKGIWV